jgi:hypothetical protein
VSCDDRGIATFDRIRYRRHDGTVFLYAFDLIFDRLPETERAVADREVRRNLKPTLLDV